MPSYKLLVPFLLGWEGGISNDKDDRGGLTNKGITYSTYQSLCAIVYRRQPTMEHFHSLTDEEVGVMVQWYWNQSTGGNRIDSQKVAEAITTWRWGSGSLGLKWFQEMMNKEYHSNLVVDGIIGSASVQAINVENPDDVFRTALVYRHQRFHTIVRQDPRQQKFLKGWLNRLEAFATRHGEYEFFKKIK